MKLVLVLIITLISISCTNISPVRKPSSSPIKAKYSCGIKLAELLAQNSYPKTPSSVAAELIEEFQTRKFLNTKTDLEISGAEIKLDWHKDDKLNRVTLVAPDGTKIGSRYFEVLDSNGNAIILKDGVINKEVFDLRLDTAFVSFDFQGQGVSTYLLARIFELTPEVKRVESNLIMDNLKAFQDGLPKRELPWDFTEDSLYDVYSRVEIDEAIANTPFYKTIKKFHFNRVVDFNTSVHLNASTNKPEWEYLWLGLEIN